MSKSRFSGKGLLQAAALLLLVYAFLVSIGMLGSTFKLMGRGLIDDVLGQASSPLVGLFAGVLATTIVQSSSTTTSLVVALVGGGALPVSTAIPVVMGANIGTSVTNTLVSLGHITRGREFYRAFSASTIHDFFNICAVAVLFPLHVATDFLSILATSLAGIFQTIGGLTFASPLKLLTAPVVNGLTGLFSERPWLLLVVSAALMFVSLRYLVTTLKSLVLGRVASLFDVVIFKNAWRALLFGLLVTVLVQSSSVTTSLVVPLAGAGLLTLRQVFPYTLGANVGTTITAILASLAVGEMTAVTVAFAHLSFNVCGILLIWPIPALRRIPMQLARRLANIARRNRWVAVTYVLAAFYALPLLALTLLR